MSEELLSIQGKFQHIVYQSDNHYTVARFKLYDLEEKTIVVTGYLSEIEKDTLYVLHGNYVEHYRYGMQFQIATMEKQLPTDYDSVISYLSGPLFPGIGKKMAESVVNTLGVECLEHLREDISLLDAVPRMNEKKKKVIQDGLNVQDDLQEAIAFFSTHGLGIRNIMRLDRIYGKEALNMVKENPYRMVEEVDGIGFKTADKLALSMGFEYNDPRRMEAALLSLCLGECIKEGDSYLLYDELKEKAQKEFEGMMDFDAALDALQMRRQLIVEENRVYHHTQYEAEEFIAEYLNTPLLDLEEHFDDSVISEQLHLLEEEVGISYDEKQVEAIHTFFKKDIMILTGGPGTGKTTVVRAMVDLFQRLYPYYTIAVSAPTGRAAKRLTELTGVHATTIHRLLKWDLESNTFGVNANEPLSEDLLIVDEASMIDQWMLYNLLAAGRNFKKILIIGDEDQLPSVGIGAILRDLIASEKFTLVRLEKIFRQKEGSSVIELAHEVKQGKCDNLESLREVRFIPATQYDVKDYIIQLVNAALEKGYEVNDIQVLSPKYSGVSGIDSLNHALQKFLNPPSEYKRELTVGYRTFREGDKILQLKNQPDDDVYNGDIGTLAEIIYANEGDNKTNVMLVDFDGTIVEYTPDFFQNITHAYCVSVHKAQGSEYPIIIMTVLKADQFMLSKRLIYTGITRASKSLILIGEREAFEKGIQTMERHERRTTLQMRLQHYENWADLER